MYTRYVQGQWCMWPGHRRLLFCFFWSLSLLLVLTGNMAWDEMHRLSCGRWWKSHLLTQHAHIHSISVDDIKKIKKQISEVGGSASATPPRISFRFSRKHTSRGFLSYVVPECQTECHTCLFSLLPFEFDFIFLDFSFVCSNLDRLTRIF